MAVQTISPYRIVSKLGAGGMGEVYLAEDTRLDRKVAIKFLPSNATSDQQAKKRLIREAQAAAKLDHSNICSIYEVGEEDGRSFIVMQYVEGETLARLIARQPLELREALDIAVQMADALAEAHSRGIIHRDIKPQNVMVTARGQVKVLDFGLAKLVQPPRVTESEAATQSLLTDPGLIIGTVPYMSPEQIRGETLDARSDIFGFGSVLYEMLSGRTPFSAGTAAETISSILTREPAPLVRYAPGLPEELQRIVRKCLAKDKRRRYQSARDLLIDLGNLKRDSEAGADTEATSRIATQPRSRIRRPFVIVALVGAALALSSVGIYLIMERGRAIDSIAVLPFVNASEDADTEYLSDGITESLINSFSRLPNLRVMSRDSVFRYKGQQTTAQGVGRDLNVQAVLTGRVVQRGSNLLISTELVDVRDNSHIWGEQYNRKLTDILAVQSEIAREISEKLRLRLTGEQEKRLVKRYTVNAEAYQLYLKGRYYWNKRTEEGLRKGIEYFNQAIEKEPNYALAYSGLADCHTSLAFSFDVGAVSPRQTIPQAEAAARKALKIDDTLAEAHTSLAFIKLLYDWDWPGSEESFKRAIELDPNYPNAHHWYSHYLMAMGRIEESLAESRRALELDPLLVVLNLHLGWHYLYARNYDQAIEQFRRTLEMDPYFQQAHLYLGWAYIGKGMYAEAIGELQTAKALVAGSGEAETALGYIYAVSGKRGDALRVLDQLKELSKRRYVSPFFIALIYAGLEEKDQAFTWLEKAYVDRSDLLVYLEMEPKLDSLRPERKFADLVSRVGLVR
ncbi:MAG: protein kinase [Acidobacteriota bacterium]